MMRIVVSPHCCILRKALTTSSVCLASCISIPFPSVRTSLKEMLFPLTDESTASILLVIQKFGFHHLECTELGLRDSLGHKYVNTSEIDPKLASGAPTVR